MKLTFIGTSHGTPEKDRFCSCTMITSGSKNYLIDAGAPIVDLLVRYGIPYENINDIFITHDHNDHMMGLYALAFVLGYRKSKNPIINTYVPTRFTYAKINYAALSHGLRKHLKMRKYKSGLIFSDDIIKVYAIKNQHIRHSYSFMVECENKRLLFSGDLRKNMTDYPKVLHEAQFDAVILEGAHSMLDSENVLKIVARTNTKYLIINHINDARNTDEHIQNLFNSASDKTCVKAYDGLIMQI